MSILSLLQASVSNFATNLSQTPLTMNTGTHHQCSLRERLQGVLSQVELVRKLCQVPSISFGVLHKGEKFCHSVGHRDSEMIHKADADTIYMLGSCSKMLTSAAIGILVEAGQLNWQDPVKKYLPGFCPIGDPRIGQEADFIDLMRHSSGTAEVGRLCLGPNGSILVDEDKLLPLLNLMPTSDSKGQRFNREWSYNNIAYGIVSQVVESLTEERFDHFVKEKILKPLRMTRTVLKRADITADANVAAPCIALKNGQFANLQSENWPCEHVSPLLAAAGIWSSVNDMLKWCDAVLSAERSELCQNAEVHNSVPSKTFKHESNVGNPLRQMNRVRRGYWTRPADDPSVSKSAAYCMGWVRMELPSSMLGAFSGNFLSREKGVQYHLKPEFMLGKSSDPLLAIGHSGGMPGSLTTIWTFPETESAVVVFCNGRGLGDASDFVAQILIQELFDLKPKVDLIPWVKKETDLAHGYFRERLLDPWTKSRALDEPTRDLKLYVGEYEGFERNFTLQVIVENDGYLSVKFNRRESSTCKLLPFGQDVYSYFIPEFDSWIKRGYSVSKFEQTLLEFDFETKDQNIQVAKGLWWLWNPEEERAYFNRIV